MQPDQVVNAYLERVSELRATGEATDETTFYGVLGELLEGLGQAMTPPVTPVPTPAARQGDHPDMGLWDSESLMLVLPVEVKGVEVSADDLLLLEQADRYARTFGGGRVLLTNLVDFVWAQVNNGGVVELERVRLADPNRVDSGPSARKQEAGERLRGLIERAVSFGPVTADPQRVAHVLSLHGRRMVERIEDAGTPKHLLESLEDTFREGLGIDLEEHFFTGTVVQTLVYSLMATWLDSSKPEQFRWSDVFASPPHVPLVRDLFYQVSAPTFLEQCDLTGVLEHVATTLTWVDRENFNALFDQAAIEYFYEPFLAAFDPEIRDKLGVWYTPRQIAEYQLARVDKHLREDLELADGLAEDAALLLDPACGTGTYLAVAVQRIYAHHRGNGEPEGQAAALTRQAALSRLVGFEVLPAAFIIAHINLARVLAKLGAPLRRDDRLRVYLTNSLRGWGSMTVPEVPMEGVEEELRESLDWKVHEPVIAVVGNPPYEGYSATDNEEEKRLLKPWIDPLWSKWGLRKHRLGDLYVRFWRIAVQRITLMTGRGVICFISNRKWLAGRSYPAMREDVLHRFDEVVVDDLHGDSRTKGGDGSVFTTATATGIRVGVAVSTLARTGQGDDHAVARVRSRNIRGGSGASKRQQLEEMVSADVDAGLTERYPSEADRWRLAGAAGGDNPTVEEYFGFMRSGLQPGRMDAVVDHDRDVLTERMRDYLERCSTWDEVTSAHPQFAVNQARYNGERVWTKLRADNAKFDESRLVRFLFRPFDVRWLYWQTDSKLLTESRDDLRRHYDTAPEQRAILAPATPRKGARPVVTSAVPCFEAVDPNGRVFPRIIRSELGGEGERGQLEIGESEWVSNINTSWIQQARNVGVEGSDLEIGDVLFFALVAIMHSPAWIAAVPPDADDFAEVPLPASPELLHEAERLGRRIADLLDPEIAVSGVTKGRLEERYKSLASTFGTDERKVSLGRKNVEGGAWTDDNGGTLWWGRSSGWSPVPREVLEFRVGGFAVVRKWLSYRKGADLSDGDLRHVTLMVRRIQAAIDLHRQLDDLYGEALTKPFDLAD